MEDTNIVDLFLERNESAISETKAKYGSQLQRIANSNLKNRLSAEECENDTYLEAWNRIPPNEPRTYLFAFLGQIIRHLAIDECRRNAARKRHALFCELTSEMEECLAGRNDVEETLEQKELSRAITAYLETISEEQRNIFVRRYWYFDTIFEIAWKSGYSQSKVKTTLFRIREGLRKYLEKEGYQI